ncbi:D-2-hydroxyacid dehydrogenase family protein [Ferrovibrio sp. MS7]|uniref:D-2-hydroxyacid dehydrogenase family protein n=1 Tax=Ferrovibrio plantarum TaxID=3119164 RepID=UPI003136491E
MRVAIIDDWQDVSRACVDWAPLQQKADVVWFTQPLGDEDATAKALADFDVLVPMRDRTKFTPSLLRKLPRLKLIAQTGALTLHIDLESCDAMGILCSLSNAPNANLWATPELTLGLMLAAMHHIPVGHANMRAGLWQEGIPFGETLNGRTLGIVGLGNIGKKMAIYGKALGMKLLAWSPNLTPERAAEAGTTMVSKEALFAESDVVTLHLVHSPKTVGAITAADLGRMKRGALLVNTARGPIVDEAALLAALQERRIFAAIDVYDQEPLPATHPLRQAGNAILTPHVGFVKRDMFTGFYEQSLENVLAFLDGKPLRLANPPAAMRNAS